MNYKEQWKTIKAARRALKIAKKVQAKLAKGVYVSQQGKASWKRIIAKSMIKNPTECEAILYDAMTEAGIQFKAQEIIGPYIADAVIGYKHVVEVDGPVHDGRAEYDQARDHFMWRRGYKVQRFTNREIKSNVNAVIERIKEYHCE